MTLVVDPPSAPSARGGAAGPEPGAAPSSPPPAAPAPARAGASLDRRGRLLLLLWLGALVFGLALVVFGFGPLFQDRIQRSLLRDYRVQVDQAANGLVDTSGQAPALGSAVGILEIGGIRLQEAVVEGVRSSDTRKGPGHVPGTAGLGQPGNSVVVGRRSGFGGPFGDLHELRKGDDIVVTTTQGQSVYEVAKVDDVTLHAEADTPANPGPAGSASADDGAGLIDTVYGPSRADQLTLVTSSSVAPWNKAKATVVVATMQDKPFPPTVQGGRHREDTGGRPDGDAKAATVLAMLVYGAVLGGALTLHRRLPTRVAYLLTVAPVIALTIVTGETLSRLFPAWM